VAITEGAHLPQAGLLLALPALEMTERELAGHGRGAQLQAALSVHHAAVRPEAVGFL